MTNIIASHWAIAGDSYPGCGNEVSEFPFAARMEAAAKAGYRGAGFVYEDLMAQARTLGYAEMSRILEANGLVDIEVEILTDWFATGDRRAASDKIRADLLAAAEGLKARHIKISGDFTLGDWSLDHLASEFAGLCAQAREVGSMVGLEIMPFTNFNSIQNTLPVIQAAGAENGGLLLDIWHMQRGKVDLKEIGTLPKGSIVSIEINDALPTIEGDLWNDTLHHRLLCGEGCFDIPTFLSEVKKTGYNGPVGIEVISATHRKLPLDVAAQSAMASVRKYID